MITYDKNYICKAASATRYELGGQVMVNNQPASRRISVLDRGSFTYLCGAISDALGNWRIRGNPQYPAGSMLVICFDDTGVYDAEVFDRVTQVAMTYYTLPPRNMYQTNGLAAVSVTTP